MGDMSMRSGLHGAHLHACALDSGRERLGINAVRGRTMAAPNDLPQAMPEWMDGTVHSQTSSPPEDVPKLVLVGESDAGEALLKGAWGPNYLATSIQPSGQGAPNVYLPTAGDAACGKWNLGKNGALTHAEPAQGQGGRERKQTRGACVACRETEPFLTALGSDGDEPCVELLNRHEVAGTIRVQGPAHCLAWRTGGDDERPALAIGGARYLSFAILPSEGHHTLIDAWTNGERVRAIAWTSHTAPPQRCVVSLESPEGMGVLRILDLCDVDGPPSVRSVRDVSFGSVALTAICALDGSAIVACTVCQPVVVTAASAPPDELVECAMAGTGAGDATPSARGKGEEDTLDLRGKFSAQAMGGTFEALCRITQQASASRPSSGGKLVERGVVRFVDVHGGHLMAVHGVGARDQQFRVTGGVEVNPHANQLAQLRQPVPGDVWLIAVGSSLSANVDTMRVGIERDRTMGPDPLFNIDMDSFERAEGPADAKCFGLRFHGPQLLFLAGRRTAIPAPIFAASTAKHDLRLLAFAFQSGFPVEPLHHSRPMGGGGGPSSAVEKGRLRTTAGPVGGDGDEAIPTRPPRQPHRGKTASCLNLRGAEPPVAGVDVEWLDKLQRLMAVYGVVPCPKPPEIDVSESAGHVEFRLRFAKPEARG